MNHPIDHYQEHAICNKTGRLVSEMTLNKIIQRGRRIKRQAIDEQRQANGDKQDRKTID